MIDIIYYLAIAWIILIIIGILYVILTTFPEIGNSTKKILKTIKGKTVYHKYIMNTEVMDKKIHDMIRYNRNLLLDNRIPINKVKFVFQPLFTYDVDKDIICPKYEIMLPIDDKTGLFRNNEPVIEIDKPENLILISVKNYKFDNNYAHLKEILKNSKLGIVIMLADEITLNPFTRNEIPYIYSVDSEVIRYADLDEEVREYKNSK